MDNRTLQQRAFILSSLRRLKIQISTYAYRFADQLIKDGWIPPTNSLDEVDSQIKLKYDEFMSAQR